MATATTKAAPTPLCSDTELVLAAAQRDLDDADYILGWFFNPLRHFVVGPALELESRVLPAVVRAVPALDPVVSAAHKMAFNVARQAYFRTHSDRCTADYRTFRDAKRQIDAFVDPKNLLKDVAENADALYQISDLRNLIGFHVHTFFEFWSSPLQNLDTWTTYTRNLSAYCKSTGVDAELLGPLLSDPFFVNVRILGAVQRARENTEIRRSITATKGAEPVDNVAVVAKMMRYACAAYGTPMMDAHDILVKKFTPDKDVLKKAPWEGGDALKSQVCEHVGIPESYITHFYLGAGGDLRVLRYYISVDEELEAVVLVIRGTYSIGGWHIDFQGQAAPFAGGEAHSGIAGLARAVVDKSRSELLEGLDANPSYGLMITGQSLGGGVAPLVNILLHQDPLISKRSIECHAFAGPPVYCSENVPPAVSRAIGNCVHYIHGDDSVPYLGVHQVRRTCAQLEAMGAATLREGAANSVATAMGRRAPTDDMVIAVMRGDADVETLPGAPRLLMPAKKVVWFVHDRERDDVNYTVCAPEDFSTLSVYLCGDTGIKHHVPQNYEYVLNKAEREGWRMKKYGIESEKEAEYEGWRMKKYGIASEKELFVSARMS